MKRRNRLFIAFFSAIALISFVGIASAEDPPPEAEGDAAATPEVTWEENLENVTPETVAMGEKAYKKCQGCHGKPDKPGKKAPHLFATVEKWNDADEEARAKYRTYVWTLMKDGVDRMEGDKKVKMPAFGEKLTQEERQAIVYHLLKNKIASAEEAPAK